MADFDPNKHLTPLPRQQKNKITNQMETVHDQYLEVKWRIVWFREVFPHGTIETEEMLIDLDREVEAEATRWVDNPNQPGKKMKQTYIKKALGYARYKATVTDGLGGKAVGTKTETAVDFGDFCEKAETGAIGRALAVLGFGTQFTGDELREKHRIVDSPLKDDDPEPSVSHSQPQQKVSEPDGMITSTNGATRQSTNDATSRSTGQATTNAPTAVKPPIVNPSTNNGTTNGATQPATKTSSPNETQQSGNIKPVEGQSEAFTQNSQEPVKTIKQKIDELHNSAEKRGIVASLIDWQSIKIDAFGTMVADEAIKDEAQYETLKREVIKQARSKKTEKVA